MRKRQTGMTLIEVIVVIAIIGIIAGISWPFYEKQQAKSRRTEAISTMMDLKNRIERCFYSANTDKGFGEGTFEGCDYLVAAPNDVTQPKGYYSLNITVTTDETLNPGKQGVGYTLTATRIPGAGQDKDTDCDTFTLKNDGERSATKSDNSANNACWGSN